LIVEDDDDHAELMRLALAENLVVNTIDRVRDGAQALEYLRRAGPYAECRRPDVVLLDLALPKVDGHEVLQAVKQDADLRTIPVVVITTSEIKADRSRAYGAHANSYVIKPIDFNRFHQMIRDLNLYWTVWNEPPA
jgi:hypothetical protein